jgi:hypothetical protein
MSNSKSKCPIDKLSHMFPDLVTNINHTYPKKNNPPPISIVLDGGGFSGSHIVGALAYLQFLVQDKRITINRISGVSVGSICALLFRLGRLDIASQLYTSTRNHFEKYADLSIVSHHLSNIYKIMPKHFYKKCKLWISYFDIKKQKHITVNKFISNEHIISIIRRSIHVPWIFDRSLALNQRFIDGLYPHTFAFDHHSERVIFLNLINMPWSAMFHVKNRTTILDRVTDGAMQLHTFLTSGHNNPFCHTFTPLSYRGFIFAIRVFLTHIIVKILVFFKNNKKHPIINNYATWILGNKWKNKIKRFAETTIRKYI